MVMLSMRNYVVALERVTFLYMYSKDGNEKESATEGLKSRIDHAAAAAAADDDDDDDDDSIE